MNRYFVKALFSGWHEVSKEQFDAFVAHLVNGSTNVPPERKAELVAAKTRIEKS